MKSFQSCYRSFWESCNRPVTVVACATLIGIILAGCCTVPSDANLNEDGLNLDDARYSGYVRPTPLAPLPNPDPEDVTPETGAVTLYTISLKRFPLGEATDIVDGMRRFPGYKSDEVVSTTDIRVYRYGSTKSLTSLYEWLVVLLEDRYQLGTNVVLATHEDAIEVLKRKGRFQ